MIAVKIKQMALFVVGTSIGLFFYEAVRSITYLIEGAAPEMGVVLNVIFSPFLSIPFGFVCYMCFFCFFKWNKSAKEWIVLGCCFSFFFPFWDMLFLALRVFRI